MNRVLVIAPHADDETLGCGGVLLKHKSKKDKINLLVVTNINKNNIWTKKHELKRKKEIEKILHLYNFDSYKNLNYEPAKINSSSMFNLIQEIDAVIKSLKPNIVYLNNSSDIHTDHQLVYKASISCLKSFRKNYLEKILVYETLSETEYANDNFFHPNFYVDISKFIEKVDNFPFPRSKEAIYSLAKIRGIRIGVKYAEAFCKIFEKE
jgi:LmbE family N-acetylglucosaminyl deacetylase